MVSLRDVFPPARLVVRTPRLELRWAGDDDLAALACVAGEGIHDDDAMPFGTPWSRGTPAEVRARLLTWHWRTRAEWTPESWSWNPVVVVDGEVVGTQGVVGADLQVRHVVETGSWIGRRHQGRGIGKEMRAAALHVAFAGLGVDRAESGAYEENAASLGVSRALGYRPNGDRVHAVEGRRRREVLLVLDRSTWEATRRDDIEVDGLDDECLAAFGRGVEAAAPSG